MKSEKTYRISDEAFSYDVAAENVKNAVSKFVRGYDTGDMAAQEYCTARVFDGGQKVAEITIVADGRGGVADHWEVA